MTALLPYLLAWRANALRWKVLEGGPGGGTHLQLQVLDEAVGDATSLPGGTGGGQQGQGGAKGVKLSKEEMAGVVDTCLLRAMIVPGAARDEELVEFLTGPNAVDLPLGEAALLASSRHKELVAFYKSKRRHREV